MKRTLSFLMSIFMLISVIVCVPVSAFAAEDSGLYTVSEEIYADAYMLIDLKTPSNTVIAQKNSGKMKYPASLTKIASTMVVLNNAEDLSAEVTVTKEALEGLAEAKAQVAGLKEGDKVSLETLLSLTMVYSACDAVNAAALYVSDSLKDFAKLMNDWAKSVGCTNTNFVNCTGLHDEAHYSTAEDLAKITLAALKDDRFVSLISQKSVSFNGDSFLHTNLMLNSKQTAYYYEYAVGIKTGTTTQAGNNVITEASKGDCSYLAIVLDSPTKKLDGTTKKCSFVDAKTLFEWAFSNLNYSVVCKKADFKKDIALEKGKGAKTLSVGIYEDASFIVPTDFDISLLTLEPVNEPSSLTAPINEGDKICDAELYYNGKLLGKVNICALQTVEKAFISKVADAMSRHKIISVVLIIFLILVLLFVFRVLQVRHIKKKRALERRRRMQQRRRAEREGVRQRPSAADGRPSRRD